MKARQTILVTGASGFIGRRLAARVAVEVKPADLRCLVKRNEDEFCRGGIESLRAKSIRPIASELVEGSGLEGLGSPDVTFHLAANTHTWEQDHSCNDLGTKHLVRALSPLGPDSHFIFASTTAVMDNRTDLNNPMLPLPCVEASPLSSYGLSKWRSEEFLRTEAKRQGFRLSIVRLCTVYGPRPRPHTLFDVLKREVGRFTLASRLNWPGLTSFIHVDDVVNCLIKVAETPPDLGETEVYLLAAESRTLADVARMLYEVAGLPYLAVKLPRAAWNVVRHVHVLCRWASGRLPVELYNGLWRFDIAVNPIFHCDVSPMAKWFPGLSLRQMAECIGEI